jgi:putative membrane protein
LAFRIQRRKVMPLLLLNGIDNARSAVGFVLPVNELVNTIVVTLTFTLIGLLLFGLAFWLIVKVSPFSIRKELEIDQNVALGIVIGAVIIGIALIVSSALHG